MGLAFFWLSAVVFPGQIAASCLGGAGIPIYEARLDGNLDGIPDLAGAQIEISGWVTSSPGTFGPGKVFSVEDGTSGIWVWADSLEVDPAEGSVVYVDGILTHTCTGVPEDQPVIQAYDELYVAASAVEMLPCGWDCVPVPVTLDEVPDAGPRLAGRLVRTKDIEIEGQPPNGRDTFLGIKAHDFEAALFVDKDTNIDGTTFEGIVESITGLLVKMYPPDGEPQFCITPRDLEDIEGGLSAAEHGQWGQIKELFR
jgi:hypothetical protein